MVDLPTTGAVSSASRVRPKQGPTRAWLLASQPFAGTFVSGFYVIPWT